MIGNDNLLSRTLYICVKVYNLRHEKQLEKNGGLARGDRTTWAFCLRHRPNRHPIIIID